MQREEKRGWSRRGGQAAESSLTWWCYLLGVIYATLKRWLIIRAQPRLSFVFRVSKCFSEAVLAGQPRKEGNVHDALVSACARVCVCIWSHMTMTCIRVSRNACGCTSVVTLNQISSAPCVFLYTCVYSCGYIRKTDGVSGERPEIFDPNAYFHILAFSEESPGRNVTRPVFLLVYR